MSDEALIARMARAIGTSLGKGPNGECLLIATDEQCEHLAKAALVEVQRGHSLIVKYEEPWDARHNRHYGPVEKRAAEIYANFIYPGVGTKPEWVDGGNSTKQDEARDLARAELRGGLVA